MLLSVTTRSATHVSKPSVQVRSALSRARKEETVDKLVAGLEGCACVFGVRYKNISVSSWRPRCHTLTQQGTAARAIVHSLLGCELHSVQPIAEPGARAMCMFADLTFAHRHLRC